MEFYDVVEERRSIKKYKNNKIEKEKLYRILESLTLIPSWSCKNCWKFIMVDDEETKSKISECVIGENPAKEGLTEAPCIFVLCADPSNTEEIDGKEYYMADCGLAMEQFMLSAVNEGLSSCWIGLFDEDKLKSVLDIPDLNRVVAITPLGYGNEIPGPRNKINMVDRVNLNKWDSEFKFS